MMKMKYLIPDIDKHTAGIIYISMIGSMLAVLVLLQFIPK